MKTVAVLGATGSVGLQALDVARKRGYRVDYMSARGDTVRMESLAREFSPRFVAMADGAAASDLKTRLRDTDIRVLSTEEGILEGIRLSDSSVVVNSIIGEAGLLPTLEVIDTGKRLALANKESLVIAGDIVMARARERGVEILPDAELAGIRSGDMLIFAKGGHNDESHNHNDIGSFALYDEQKAVLVDVGIGTYTRFTFSEYRYDMIPWVKAENHNVPAFDGITQQYGRKYYADSFSATDDEIKISFASAYPKEAGLSLLERKLSFTESGMSCLDSFVLEKGNVGRVREVFMSVMPVEVVENTAVIDGKYRISASAGRVSCEFIKFEDSSLEGTWKTEGVTRICFDAEGVDEIEIRVDNI